jgi:hypothetical protein
MLLRLTWQPELAWMLCSCSTGVTETTQGWLRSPGPALPRLRCVAMSAERNVF